MLRLSISLCLLSGLAVEAQTSGQAVAPTAYTVTQVNSMMGLSVTTTVYRNGEKAVIDNTHPAVEPGGKPSHIRSWYDLKAGVNYTLDLANPETPCGTSSFSGDWGDPYHAFAQMTADDPKAKPTQVGTETIAGVPSNVLETSSPDGVVKVWVDQKTGLVMRLQMAPVKEPVQVLIDTKQESLAPPPASVFALPAACASLAPAKHIPTDAERIAAETGESADDFALATHGPGSKNSCSIVIRAVQAGTMAPLNRKIQIAADMTYDIDHPPAYTFGMAVDGTQTFSGGGMRELTSQMRNGMLRIDNPPPYFNLELNLINPGQGAGGALIYRQCFAPVTVLLYVVVDPNDGNKGSDWLWVKQGKFAKVP